MFYVGFVFDVPDRGGGMARKVGQQMMTQRAGTGEAWGYDGKMSDSRTTLDTFIENRENRGGCRGNLEEEEAREQFADRLLMALPRDPECQFYTEQQLIRRGQTRCVASTELLVEILAVKTVQAAADELLFLASMTPLEPLERVCLCGWIAGWTQQELCLRFREAGIQRQQQISLLLRRAWRKCCGEGAPTFAQFSRHAIYRRPSRRRDADRRVRCVRCQGDFVRGLGSGRYCSSYCQEQSLRRE